MTDEELQAIRDNMVDYDYGELLDKAQKLLAEIERLDYDYGELLDKAQKLLAEIERLRGLDASELPY